MTTIVPTTEEEPAISVVRFMAEIASADAGSEVADTQVNTLCSEAQRYMVLGRWFDLASLMLTSSDVVFSKVAEKDLECIFTVICNLVTVCESLDESLEMAKIIASKVTQQPSDKPALRVKIMFNLYNLLENPYSRFYIYMKTLNLALSGKVTEQVTFSFKKIDSFLSEWNLEILDQRVLFLTISNVLRENKSSVKDSFIFLTKYLGTFSDEDSSTISEAKEEAIRAIVEFVKAPDIFQCDLLDMPAVAQLEKDSKHAALYELLKIFLTQRLNSYLEFQASDSSFLKGYGLIHDDCVAKMRLLSLVDLGSYECRQIPYDLVKETLQISGDEVEHWVIKAIAAKLIDCKMDQLNEVVILSRCSKRVFGERQWYSLRTQLGAWRVNVARVVSTIRANKTIDDGSQAAMQGLAIH